jgi:hypothetical protein
MEPIKNNIIKLNVGGIQFMTTKLTLEKSGFFSALFSSSIPTTLDDQGVTHHFIQIFSIFIDRDPTVFGILLNFLRTGELEIPNTISTLAVHREADFYLITLPQKKDAHVCVRAIPLSYGGLVKEVKLDWTFYILHNLRK